MQNGNKKIKQHWDWIPSQGYCTTPATWIRIWIWWWKWRKSGTEKQDIFLCGDYEHQKLMIGFLVKYFIHQMISLCNKMIMFQIRLMSWQTALSMQCWPHLYLNNDSCINLMRKFTIPNKTLRPNKWQQISPRGQLDSCYICIANSWTVNTTRSRFSRPNIFPFKNHLLDLFISKGVSTRSTAHFSFWNQI